MDNFYNKLLDTIHCVEAKTGLKPNEIRCNDKFECRMVEDYYYNLEKCDTTIYFYNGYIFGIKEKKDSTVPDNTFRMVYEECIYNNDSIFTTSIIRFVDVYEVE